ncbi:MICOS complex subunit mic10 [Ceratocystis lukuohia]|uniref:MICOS complex subunit MIC10 n=2 Tax=Ceratocystis TaxID=5157 RepID=A0A2C5X7C6_9PEZI|nr:MICOS complex subunit mic10 [Ceratocystis fimbriata CBS 114723]
MADSTARPSAPVARPVSEALLNEKWDRCLSNLIVKSSLGLGFGVVFSVLLFKRRTWPAVIGVGFGAGRAYEECNISLKVAAQNLKNQS